jgi:acetoacetyl-CoA synthetase
MAAQAIPTLPRMDSQMVAFTRLLEARTGSSFRSWPELHAASVEDFRAFWAAFLQWSRPPLGIEGSADVVCAGDDVETAIFFPGLQLNFADALLNLQVAGADAPALLECHADGTSRRWTRGELREQVARAALGLQRLGVRAGDRVVAVMRNEARAAVAALAVTALGATFSSASSDMGLQALLDRFGPLRPAVLLAHLQPMPVDGATPMPDKIAALARELDGLRTVVSLDGGTFDAPRPVLACSFDEVLAGHDAQHFAWRKFPFNHPLLVMFSSGTTGRPKCIVHGAGGTLLEHVKEHRLHTGLRPGERMYFHTGCGWMMWNWQLSALASGVEIVTYDGTIDSVDRLWRLVAAERVDVFGTSPGYLKMCEEAGVEPSSFGLDRLRAVLSTGAVLHDGQFDWVRRHAKDVPVQSVTGGTDIIGCFLLGHPDLPVRAGELQCRSLGLDVQAWRDGAPCEGVGHLVCVKPFPSRPLGFFGDADGSKFHAAYFSQNPGVWTHGDLVEFTPGGGARMHGRSDGIVNVRGTKLWPGEIYRVLARVPGIVDAMVVERRGEPSQLVALLVLAPGIALDPALASRVRREIASALTAAHVPDLLLDVPALPVTHNGKPSEAAARATVNREPPANLAALRNPECLDAIRAHPALARAQDAVPLAPEAPLVDRICRLWESHLGIACVRPQDNYFELGGNSLVAARLLRSLQDATGCALPLAALLHAPTPAALAQLVEQRGMEPVRGLVPMRAGTGTPLFLVHGLSGTIMECWGLVRALRTPRPVWGVQAHGIDGEQPPLRDVRAIASGYVNLLRAVQSVGPYALAGFSFGGVIAYEMAQQLANAGQGVEALVLIDPYVMRRVGTFTRTAERLLRGAGRLARLPVTRWPAFMAMKLRQLREGGPSHDSGVPRAASVASLPPAQQLVYDAMCDALAAYDPPRNAAGRVVFLRADEPLEGYVDPMPAWRLAAGTDLGIVRVPGTHLDLVGENAARTAAVLDAALDEASARARAAVPPVLPRAAAA